VTTYVINTANTWEQKSVTITGDTASGAGFWGTTNGGGIGVYFDLGCGTNQQATANTWTATNARRVSGTVRLMNTSSATWQVTGVQLEVGTTATPFERRLYGQELANCQRYYYRMTNANSSYSSFGIGQSTGTTTIRIMMSIPTTMRTFSQSFDVSSTATWILQNSAGSATISSIGTSTNNGLNIFELEFTVSTVTAGAVYALYSNTSAAFVGVSAEL
jgi:hypothetical protein